MATDGTELQKSALFALQSSRCLGARNNHHVARREIRCENLELSARATSSRLPGSLTIPSDRANLMGFPGRLSIDRMRPQVLLSDVSIILCYSRCLENAYRILLRLPLRLWSSATWYDAQKTRGSLLRMGFNKFNGVVPPASNHVAPVCSAHVAYQPKRVHPLPSPSRTLADTRI